MRNRDVFDSLESNVRTYCRNFPVVLSAARGHLLTDEAGNTYIDFLSGAGVMSYGHNNPKIIRPVIEYLERDGIVHSLDLHTSAKKAFLETFESTILVPRLLNYKVQFAGPTGTNAVEAALKLARKVTGRHSVVAFTNGFHGVSLGALAATANGRKRKAAGTALHDVTRMPYDGFLGTGDTLAYIEAMLQRPGSGIDPPAAFILETVQAEGGLKVASSAWLQGIADLARRVGALLIVDDIQAGCGRTGPFFSFEDAGIQPDIVCLSKAIGGAGFPMALVLIDESIDIWEPGEHCGTFRGNNLAFVAATAALDSYWRDGNLEKDVRRKGKIIADALQRLAGDGAVVRGRGMIQGIAWTDPSIARAVSAAAFRRGLIIETCGPQDEVLKLLPPLTIDDRDLAKALAVIAEAIAEVVASTPRAAAKQSDKEQSLV